MEMLFSRYLITPVDTNASINREETFKRIDRQLLYNYILKTP